MATVTVNGSKIKTNLKDLKLVNNTINTSNSKFRTVKKIMDPKGQEHLPLRDGGDAYITDQEVGMAIQMIYSQQFFDRASAKEARTALATLAMFCHKKGVDADLCEEWFQYNCQRWSETKAELMAA